MADIESILAQFENLVRNAEKMIFGEGPFCAKKIEENLRLIKFSASLESITGRPGAISLSEKKNYYRETLDEIGEGITPVKEVLTKLKNSGNNRILSLLESIEKCEKEMSKIGGVIQSF